MSITVDETSPWVGPGTENSRGKRRFNRRAIAAAIIAIAVIASLAITVAFMWPKKSPFDTKMCRIEECGQTGPKFLGTPNVGGRLALQDEFPYQVVLTDQTGDIYCGGTLLNDRWVLTAAHCLYSGPALRTPNSINVSVGVQFVGEIPFNAIKVENFWPHPNYKRNVSKKHDIALIKTKESVEASSKRFVDPICLPYEDEDTKDVQIGKISGFGSKEEKGLTQNWLGTASVKIVPDDSCRSIYKEDFDAASMICAGDLNGGADACHGDSGGPLSIKNSDGSYVLRGITSFGKGCGREDTPGVYTKVSAYMDWTCETMAKNGMEHLIIL